MKTTTILMFAAIAAALGTVGVVAIQPAFASTGDFDFDIQGNNNVQQRSDQSDCDSGCQNDQNVQIGNNDNFQ